MTEPARAHGFALTILRAACDGAFALDAATGRPKAALASGPDQAEGPTRLRLDLRGQFSDGERVTPQALIANLDRVVAPSSGSPWADLVSRIKGVAERRSGAEAISGLGESGDALVIELTEPYGEIATVLAHPGLIPISPSALVEAEDADGVAEVVCAGPYRIEPGVSEGGVRLRRRAGYLGGEPGLADVIVVKSFESEQAALEAFRAGTLDISPFPGPPGPQPESEAVRVSSPSLQVTQLVFDVTKPETQNRGLRQALSLSFDRLAVIDAAFGDGRAPATRWLTDRTDASAESGCASFARKISDPQKAKQALDAAGTAPFGKIPVFFDREQVSRLVAQALQVQAKDALGIELEPRPLDPPDFEVSLSERKEPGAWVATSDPPIRGGDFQLGSLFGSGAPRNLSRFSEARFDALTREARAAATESERDRLYEEAERVACEAMPSIPLWTGVRHWIYNPAKVTFRGSELDLSGDLLLRHAHAR